MLRTPSQRNTTSNSNQYAQLPLQEMKTIIDKIREEAIKPLEDKVDSQSKLIKSLLEQMDHLMKVNSELDKKCKTLEERIDQLSSNRSEEMEDRKMRKRNVIISGLPEQGQNGNEQKTADRERVEKILEHLSVREAKNAIEGITRLGKPSKSGHRLLKVSFRDQDVQQEVLRKANQLRHVDAYRKTFINPDLTPSQRANLTEEMKRRREAGEDVVISKGKVVPKF